MAKSFTEEFDEFEVIKFGASSYGDHMARVDAALHSRSKKNLESISRSLEVVGGIIPPVENNLADAKFRAQVEEDVRALLGPFYQKDRNQNDQRSSCSQRERMDQDNRDFLRSYPQYERKPYVPPARYADWAHEDKDWDLPSQREAWIEERNIIDYPGCEPKYGINRLRK